MTPYRHILLADTGPLYAAVDIRDQFHRQSRDELGRLEATAMGVGVIVPTMAEAHTLVLYRLGAFVARRWLGELTAAVTIIPVSDDDVRIAIDPVQRFSDQPITLHDALVAAVGARLGLPIWTYDHHFDLMRSQRWR